MGSCKAFEVKKLDKCGKKYRNVLSVSKKDVPLHSQFGGMAMKVALKKAPNLLKRQRLLERWRNW